MTRPTSSERAARNSSISASGVIAASPCSSRSRTRSPSGVPPGSRVTTGARPARADRSSATCVDLPAPSGPSNVTSRPRLPGCGSPPPQPSPTRGEGGSGLVNVGGWQDPQSALGLLAGAARDQVVLGHELVLHPADVGVLRRDLLRLQRRLDAPDRVHRLVQRAPQPRVRLLAEVEAA